MDLKDRVALVTGVGRRAGIGAAIARELAGARAKVFVSFLRRYDEAQTWAQRAQLFVNDGSGRFADGSLGAGDLCSAPRVGRGLSCGDLDGDGDLDLVATECGGPTVLLRNESAGGRAVVLDGVPRGARVEASFADGTRQVREAGPQPSYLSQTEGLVHLGLGPAENRLVGLSIAWRKNLQRVALARPLSAGRYRIEGSVSGWTIKIP